MNIVFFGTSEFAIEPLRAILASRHKVLALVTQPDRKKGRSLKLSPPPTKVLAVSKNIPVYQPQDASSGESFEYLKKLGADLFVVISFGQILKSNMLSIPARYCINLHGSLLPKYRGAAPTNWAVINGESLSGVTVIRMDERMDEGDVILKQEVGIEPVDTNITLSEKLSDMGARLVIEALDLIGQKKEKFTKQDDSKASYAPKLRKEDGLIDWNEDANVVYNRIRGLIPWPGAYTYYNSRILKILQTKVVPDVAGKDAAFGEVLYIGKEGIAVKAGSGAILIEYLQLEGKKDMDAAAFVRGHKIESGYRFKGSK